MDREGRDPIEAAGRVESVLGIRCAPVTWPVGSGRGFRGVYRIQEDRIILFDRTDSGGRPSRSSGISESELDAQLGTEADRLREEIELLQGASHPFDLDAYLAGELTRYFWFRSESWKVRTS